MRIAEVLHFFFFFKLFQVRGFWHVVHSSGEGSACEVRHFGLLWMFTRKLNCTAYWRNALIYWKPTVFAVKTCPFFPHMDIQADSLMRTQKIILRAWKILKNHYNRSMVPSQLGLSYPLERSKPAQAERQQQPWAYVCGPWEREVSVAVISPIRGLPAPFPFLWMTDDKCQRRCRSPIFKHVFSLSMYTYVYMYICILTPWGHTYIHVYPCVKYTVIGVFG